MSELKRLKIKDIGQIDSGFAFSSSDFQEFGLPVIRMSDLKKGYVQTKTAARVPSSKTIGLEKFQIKPGDLLLGMSGSLDAYGVASEGVELSFINQRVGRFSVFDEEKSCYAFFSKLLTSSEYLRYAFKEAVGVAQLNISPKQIEDFSFPQIPLEEQRYIAQILDTLDTAIHETEAIIAKLKAIKQGLLHDLLTRGIDANGELRPPQTEAPHLYKESPLGWIPREWEVRPLSSCIASLDAGVSVNSEDRPHGANEIGVLKTSALSQGGFYPDQNKTVLTKEARLVREPVAADSILVSRMNTPQLVGESCYVVESWPTLFLPDRIWQLKKTAPDSVHMRWLSYVLLTSNYRAYIEVHATGTSGSMKNLPKSRLREMPVAFPKPDEQRLIAERLAKTDDVIGAESMQLVKLKAEKSGLMDDLLTGRVRVTPLLEAAAP